MNKLAHENQKVGLASAMAIVLLVIIMIVTLLQNLFFKYVFKDAVDEDKNAGARREKKLARIRAKEAAKA